MEEAKVIQALQGQGEIRQLVIQQAKEIEECKAEIKILKEEMQTQKIFARETNININQIKDNLLEFKNQQQKANENLLAEIQKLKDKPGIMWDRLISGILGAIAGAMGSGIFNKFVN